MSNEFELENKAIYLAACSHSPFYNGMRESLLRYQEDLIEWGNPWDLWGEKVDEARKLFAKIIHASPEEISPNFSVSSAFGALLSAFIYNGRYEILTSDLEYPTTNHLILAQKKFGAKQVLIRHNNYRLTAEQYRSLAGQRTKLLTAIHVSSINGFMQDLRALTQVAREAGAAIYVDAYQSVGNSPIDVKRDEIDFLTAGTLKYLLGLPGLAFLYVRQDLIEDMEPAFIGWFSQKDPFRFGPEKIDYASTADRFQSGTWSIPSIYASITGMKTILSLGISVIRSRIEKLTERAITAGDSAGLVTISPREPKERGAIVSFVVPEAHSIEKRLRFAGIIASSRDVGIRIAPHFYNTTDEVDTAVERISEFSRSTG